MQAALSEAGIDPAPLLLEVGINPDCLDDADARVPVESTARLWTLSVARTGDSAFGLQVARAQGAAVQVPLLQPLLGSASVAEALQRLCRYLSVVTEFADLVQFARGDSVVLRARARVEHSPPEAMDALMYSIVRLVRSHAGRDLSPRRVLLRRQQPEQWPAFERAFRCPLRYSAERDELHFDGALAVSRVDPGGSSDSAADLRLQQQVVALKQHSLPTQVEQYLLDHLAEGEPRAHRVAAAMGLSLRTFQRSLTRHGTSFTALVDGHRRRQSDVLLDDHTLSVADIAFLLGFSELAAYTHAHQRWSGCSPSIERRRRRGLVRSEP
jgi:AraC-like DNA-binding protein